jgi:aspartate--ammonia ligase
LDYFQTQEAIQFIKTDFEKNLSKKLNLLRVSAPKFLIANTGLLDDLAGTQKPVSFKVKFLKEDIEIVHSLAKWKRLILGEFKFPIGVGLYTDMDAIRKDEDVDSTHSVYVDQWDWEKVITKEQRNIKFLKKIVKQIYSSMYKTKLKLNKKYKQLEYTIPKDIHFIHSVDLQKLYPKLTPKEREDKITEQHGAVFIIGIGADLSDNKPHDIRATDYDDWSTIENGKPGLNGDILVWDKVSGKALELSSMGIRVDKDALLFQLKEKNEIHKLKLDYHKKIISNKIPLSIGGGIGQSRLSMFILEKAHIGEVQSCVWPKGLITKFKNKGVIL